MLLIPLLLACVSPCADGYGRDDGGHCVPLATGTSDDTGALSVDDTALPGDTADTSPPDDTADSAEPAPEWALGDPIETLAYDNTDTWELLDAAIIGDSHAILVGLPGYVIQSLDDGAFVVTAEAERAYRVAVDGDLAWVATRNGGIHLLDVADPSAPVKLGDVGVSASWHEDIAADGGLALVAAQEDGGVLVDSDLQILGRLEADYAFGAGLFGERAVLTDGDEVILWDVSDPSSPAELDRVDVGASGQDVSFDGERVAVATGGDGVAVLDVVGDTLAPRGTLPVPDATFGVALDGDHLWISAWDQIVLAWVGVGDPMVLGHEPAHEFTCGIDALDGRAVAADWFYATVVGRVDGVTGPEIEAPATVWFPDGEDQALHVRNWGAEPLSVRFDEPNEYQLGATELSLGPEESGVIWVTPGGESLGETVRWTSDDPDEPEGWVELSSDVRALGTEHFPLELRGFQWPDSDVREYALSDYLGRVVFLVYFGVS